VVLIDKVQEPGQQLGAFFVSQAVDVLDVPSDGEDALPARNRIGAHDGVDGLEVGSDVLGGATGLVVEPEAGSLGDLAEARLLKGGRETLEELLVRLADAVVDFVA